MPKPVFYDVTGKRWRRAKQGFVVVATLFIVLAAAIILLIVAPEKQIDKPGISFDAASEIFNTHNIPVIGTGVLIRAVRVQTYGNNKIASDIFTGKQPRKLSPHDSNVAGQSNFAIQRYGNPGNKTIALTFDDGPDPIYTPKILDLLSRESAQATFFAVGTNIVKNPDIARRTVDEGHILGNHSLTHPNFDITSSWLNDQEISQTAHILTATTGYKSKILRIPFAGETDEAFRDSINSILLAQQLGYIVASYSYDTRDWTFYEEPRPDKHLFDTGRGLVMLMHDGGGKRDFTLSYLNKLIPMAKKAGYKFVTVAGLYKDIVFGPTQPTMADTAALTIANAVWVWPHKMVLIVFAIGLLLIFITNGTNIALALAQHRKVKRLKPIKDPDYRPLVSVLIPAHNEADVLEQGVRSLLNDSYRKLEVIIINDGSDDNTALLAAHLAKRYRRLRTLNQPQGGKAVALNHGLGYATGEIIISVDADTILGKGTIYSLVKHFSNPAVGGVAGYVKVGNIRNALTLWQSLEYTTSIALERNAQAFLGAITIVPGACGAWRKQALQKAGGFPTYTLAEDCDTALAIHAAGYTILQENKAVGYTECPLTIAALATQRFRWTYGNLQSFWRHRKMFFNRNFSWLGLFVLPSTVFCIAVQLFFWPLLIILTIENLVEGQWDILMIFLGITLALQAVIALVGLCLAKESLKTMLVLPLTRLVYGPLKTYLLYQSIITALKGRAVGWNKLSRTATVNPQYSSLSRIGRKPV